MKTIRRLLVVALKLCALALLGSEVFAHEARPAYLQVEETAADRFDVFWKQPVKGDVALSLAPRVSNRALDVPPTTEYSTNTFVIRQWRGLSLARASFDGATVSIEGLQATLTDAFVSIRFANGQQIETLLRPSHPTLTIRLAGTGRRDVSAYLMLGVEHILTGFDHLAFVLGLVLLVRDRSRLLAAITAFTVAHSITLAVAALGYARLPTAFIESLVALSIVFIAVELTRSWRGREGLTTARPWLIAFAFGLLHGFAFAGSLAEIGLPQHNIPGALLLFNCGVEIGQMLFVVGVVASCALLRRWHCTGLSYYGRWSVAYGIGALACYWTLTRFEEFIS
jgi:hydrogenase/urease accessory protein HupE